MNKKMIAGMILLALAAGCDNEGSQGRGMMGGGMMSGGGMMGKIEITGERPPQESDARYIQGYQKAKVICSQCHAMPHPDQHASSEWPGVIARMEGHIRTYKKVMPDKDELESIVKYYSGNSG